MRPRSGRRSVRSTRFRWSSPRRSPSSLPPRAWASAWPSWFRRSASGSWAPCTTPGVPASPPDAAGPEERAPLDGRDLTILLAILAAFAIYIYGAQRLGWEFNELAALFFAVGVLAGFLGRLGMGGTTDAFVDGFRSMTLAALLVGFARAIYVVLNEGQIVDTIVHGLFTPIAELPTDPGRAGNDGSAGRDPCAGPEHQQPGGAHLAAAGAFSDLIGLSRQVTVLAYQYGAGLCEIVTPTNGALMAMLAAAGVRYEEWLKFVVPLYAGLMVLAALALALGVAVGLS